MHKQKQTISEAYTAASIRALIEREAALLDEIAKQMGIIHGKTGIPSVYTGRLQPCIEKLTAGYNTFNAKVGQMWLANLHWKLGSAKRKQILAENEKLERTIQVNEKEYALRDAEHRATFPLGAAVKAAIGVFLLLCLVSADATYLANSLVVVMPNLLAAIILAIGIAVAAAVLAEYGPVLIDTRIRSRFLRAVAYCIFFLAITSLFLTFSIFRSEYIHTTTGKETAWYPFFIFNTVLFAAIYLVGQFIIRPAFSALHAGIHILRAQYRNWQLKRKTKKLESKMKENETVLNEYLEEKATIMANHKADEIYVAKRYAQSVAVYKEYNLESRSPDKSIPDSFSDDLPELDTYTDGIDI